MAWRTVTEDDVLTALSGKELESYRTAALKLGQTDPVAPTITQVVEMVRGYVAASGKYILGDGETIPGKLLQAALAIVVVRIPARVNQPVGKSRETQEERAIKLLEQVAAGKYGLEEPEIPSTEITAQGRPSFSGRPRRQGRPR